MSNAVSRRKQAFFEVPHSTRGRCHTQPPRCHARLGVISAVLAFWAQYHCRHARNPHPDPA